MINNDLYYEAIILRKTEEALLDSFSKGLINGTVHTCIGQEFSALAFCKQIRKTDFVYSNHRCHGHYIAFTGDYYGLISEVFGKGSGICGGVGGSQHLCSNNFFSNGIQGGIVPVAAGMALAEKLRGTDNIGLVFIGDGTLGEGIVYEVMNIVSKWEIPLLIVLENNHYAQSTHQSLSLAGEILKRPLSFGIQVYENTTEQVSELFEGARDSIAYVRETRKPAFHLVHTYRLAPHSKGDDFRDPAEIQSNLEKDPIHMFSRNNEALYAQYAINADKLIQDSIREIKNSRSQSLIDYYGNSSNDAKDLKVEWNVHQIFPESERFITKLNKTFLDLMDQYRDVLFVGEDIRSPYGGAFKATKGLSEKYPERVFSTPISEAGITGIANGLAMKGYRPILEIMFGDFITLTLDQLVNHASKFYYMYNKQIKCPIIMRTPMGGKRGYGPTHSQTLDKFLIGIDNIKVIALNTLIHPYEIYKTIYSTEEHPVIIVENKIDYARLFSKIDTETWKNFICVRCNSRYPVLRISPKSTGPDVSIVTYGGLIHDAFKAMEKMFFEKEILSELIILSQIHPLPVAELIDAIRTEYIFTVEEGSCSAGVGSEIVSTLIENGKVIKKIKRIASLPLPTPSSKELEQSVLCNPSQIVSIIYEVMYGS